MTPFAIRSDQLLMLLVLACFACSPRAQPRAAARTPTRPAPRAVVAPPTWRPLPTRDAPSARELPHLVATDRELIVWGGDDPRRERYFRRANDVRRVESPSSETLRGGVFDFRTERWRPMSADGQPANGKTGDVDVYESLHSSFVVSLAPAFRAIIACVINGQVAECARYDLDLDRWRVVATPPRPRLFGCAPVFGGASVVCAAGDHAIVYSVALDRWSALRGEASDPRGTTDLGFRDVAVNGITNTAASINVFYQGFDRSRVLTSLATTLSMTPDGVIVEGDPSTWTPRFMDAQRAPLGRVGPWFLSVAKTSYASLCDHLGVDGCIAGYQITRAAEAQYDCRTVITRGPSAGLTGDGSVKLPRCGVWRGGPGIACVAERVFYNNPSFTFKALDSYGFVCAWEGAEPVCSNLIAEGQPSLRRHSGYEVANDSVYVWGGRSTVLDPDACVFGPPTHGCGLSLDGELLSDGYVLPLSRAGRPAVIAPCYGGCRPEVDPDAWCEPPRTFPAAVNE